MKRRDFIKTSALLAGAAAAAPSILAAQSAPRIFKVGVVGCGARGFGAVRNLMNAAAMLTREGTPVEIKVVAAADFFREKALHVAKEYGCPEQMAFGGAAGYRKVMESDAEIVIDAAPLNFRPLHFAAAVAAGKHCFVEKAVAVDGVGCRRFIAAAREAARRGLSVVSGLQFRHQRGYLLIANALRTGKVSPVLGGTVYWNGAVPWVRPRQPGQSNAAYLCNNWLNFAELSGDHVCEQHVHNLDIANWYIGRYPKTALGFGGRARRKSGNQYDFFSVDFDYGEGVHIHSMCRQIDGCASCGSHEIFRTADSVISGGASVKSPDGRRIALEGDFLEGNPYDIEHYDLLKSIMGIGPYWNDGETVAMATACGVIARLSAYTGKIVKLSSILTEENSEFYDMDCVPRAEDFERGDVPMPAHGDDSWPLPGKPWRNLEEYLAAQRALG